MLADDLLEVSGILPILDLEKIAYASTGQKAFLWRNPKPPITRRDRPPQS